MLLEASRGSVGRETTTPGLFMSQPRITVTIGRDGKRVCILVLFFALFLVLNFHRYEKDMKLFLGFLLIFFSLCHLLMYLLIYLFIYHENQPLFD